MELTDDNIRGFVFPSLIYNRCSGYSQNPKPRTKACRAWCVRTGQVLVHQIEDFAKTGTNLDRPGVIKLRELAKIPFLGKGFFKLIVVPEGSRISRDALDTVFLLRELWKGENKIFYSVDDDKFYWKQEHISEMVSDALSYEKELTRLVRKLAKGRKRKEERTGKKIKKDKLKLPLEEIINSYVVKGRSLYSIAKDYTYKTKKGKVKQVSWITIKRRLVECGIKIRINPKLKIYLEKLKVKKENEKKFG